MVHLMPDTWNWPGETGKPIRVIVFSNAPKVELFLNGDSLGAEEVPHDAHAEWQVPYEPGILTAKAYAGGKMVATDEVQTTSAPAKIALLPERKELTSSGEDAVVVPVSILDGQGRVVQEAANRVTFEISGDGKILGVGNGNPADHDTDRADNRRKISRALYRGGETDADMQGRFG